MPEGAVYVGRPSRWGNRWRADDALGRALLWDAETVTDLFRIDVSTREVVDRTWSLAAWLAPLRGRDLACWCPLEDADGNPVPCHADVLLELAKR